MLSITICDDIPEEALALECTIRQALPNEEYTLTAYCNAESLLAAQAAGRNADILLLDICMPQRDGISVAREINRVSPATKIIFISAHAEYSVDVYEAEHVYFLVKPVRPEKLSVALVRACEHIRKEQNTRLRLPVKGSENHILTVSEIIYFERQNHVTRTLLSTGNLVTGLKLSDIEPLLPPGVFARPHNSYLVNLLYVRATTRTSIRMSNGDVIPVSNQKRAAFMRALAESL